MKSTRLILNWLWFCLTKREISFSWVTPTCHNLPFSKLCCMLGPLHSACLCPAFGFGPFWTQVHPFPPFPLQDSLKSVFSDLRSASSNQTNLGCPREPPSHLHSHCTFSYKENNDSICSHSSLCSRPKLSYTMSPSKILISSYTAVPTGDPGLFSCLQFSLKNEHCSLP